ncbi:MAG: alpha/beta hydrolase family protein [Pseudobacter sp.]|uniref:alpha/beta hydrolase family protein n=1 Tax=Pseudobacter sp. TaxID=2045420 RepID=UPI003F801F91
MRRILLITVFLYLINSGLKAQQEFDGLRGTHNWIGFSDAPNSLYHHLASQAFRYLEKREAGIQKIQTLSEWKQRQQWVSKKLREVVGEFPAKTPLNARVTRTIQKDDYTIEHIIYESMPGYYVTASLFIPRKIKGKAPAIIYCSGHSNTGYRSYQNILLNLVHKGFIVLAFDPVGQGERLQYYNPASGKSEFQWPAFEHSYAGAQLFITGNTLARYFTWDCIRAVDYLVTRKEVDTARIGITGRSGGGTQSAYTAAFDSRIRAVATENYITNYNRLFQSMGPQDAEQCFLNGIQQGLDMADLLMVHAPKPVLIIATTQDMFPIQGTMETAAELARIYKSYNAAGNCRMITDDAPHASTKKNREAMYAFFQRCFELTGDSTDIQYKPLTAEELQVTTTGQVSTALHSETVFGLNVKEAAIKQAVLNRKRSSYPAGIPAMLREAKKISGFQQPAKSRSPLFVGRAQRPGYSIEKFLLHGEGDYILPYTLWKPDSSSGKAIIYLHPSGKSAEAAAGGEIEWFVKQGVLVLASDLPGIGELGPGEFRGDSYIDSVSYNCWFAGLLTGRSITGIQAGDVIRLLLQLQQTTGIREVYGLAHQQMGPVLLHAAAFDTGISKVALIQPYNSYRSLAGNPKYKPAFLHSTVAGSAGIYDLPDLAASLFPRELFIAGMTDANGNAGNISEIQSDLSVISNAYRGQLRSTATNSFEQLAGQLKAWLGH